MSDSTNRVCIVTGGSTGVGYASALALAREAATVVVVCRNRKRGETAIRKIHAKVPNARVRLNLCNLASLTQVRELGSQLASEYPQIDLLVNNAGVYRASREITEDGFEKTFAVNHLAHFLLTHYLIPSLRQTKGRVITVSSEAHRGAKVDRASLEDTIRGRRRYGGMRAYSDSKLANVLFTVELARRHPVNELATAALHPGVLATRIWNQNHNALSLLMRVFKPFLGRPMIGGGAVLFLATAAREEIHGRYYDKQRPVDPSPKALDPELGHDLWQLSAALVGISD